LTGGPRGGLQRPPAASVFSLRAAMDVWLLHNKPSYPARAGYPVRRGFSIPSLTPRSTGSPAFAGDDGWGCGAFAFNQTQPRDLAAQCARAIDLSLAPQRGRGECRMPAAPAVSCAIGSVRTHTRYNEYTGFTRHPRTQWLYGLFRALPGDRACLPPSPSDMFLSKPGWADLNSANLTPASGCQDHTTSPYATSSLVRVLLIAHKSHRPALQPRRTQDAAASTATHPA
jgi:hypothetical protein